jgi:hypothetical protein
MLAEVVQIKYVLAGTAFWWWSCYHSIKLSFSHLNSTFFRTFIKTILKSAFSLYILKSSLFNDRVPLTLKISRYT